MKKEISFKEKMHHDRQRVESKEAKNRKERLVYVG